MLIFKNDVIHNVHCYFVFFGIPVVILSIYRINVFSCLKNKLRYQIDHIHQIIVQSLGKATNNTVIWTKIIHDTRLIFSLFHDTRLIFWTFHATRLTPLRPSGEGKIHDVVLSSKGRGWGNCKFCKIADGNHGDITVIYRKKGFYKRRSITSFRTKGLFTWRWGTPGR